MCVFRKLWVSGNNGFGMLSILAGTAIIGSFVMLVGNFLNGMYKAQRVFFAHTDFLLISAKVQFVVSRDEICSSGLKDYLGNKVKFDPSLIPSENPYIPPSDGTTPPAPLNVIQKIKVGTNLLLNFGQGEGYLSLYNVALNLRALLPTPTDEVVGGISYDRYSATMNLYASRTLGTLTQEFPLYLLVNKTTKEIEYCGSSGASRTIASAGGSGLIGAKSIYFKATPEVKMTPEIGCLASLSVGDTTCPISKATLNVTLPPNTRFLKIKSFAQNLNSSDAYTELSEDHADADIVVDIAGQKSTGHYGVTGGRGDSYLVLFSWNDRPFTSTAISNASTAIDAIRVDGDTSAETTYGTNSAGQFYPHFTTSGDKLTLSGLPSYTPIQEVWMFEFYGG